MEKLIIFCNTKEEAERFISRIKQLEKNLVFRIEESKEGDKVRGFGVWFNPNDKIVDYEKLATALACQVLTDQRTKKEYRDRFLM